MCTYIYIYHFQGCKLIVYSTLITIYVRLNVISAIYFTDRKHTQVHTLLCTSVHGDKHILNELAQISSNMGQNLCWQSNIWLLWNYSWTEKRGNTPDHFCVCSESNILLPRSLLLQNLPLSWSNNCLYQHVSWMMLYKELSQTFKCFLISTRAAGTVCKLPPGSLVKDNNALQIFVVFITETQD